MNPNLKGHFPEGAIVPEAYIKSNFPIPEGVILAHSVVSADNQRFEDVYGLVTYLKSTHPRLGGEYPDLRELTFSGDHVVEVDMSGKPELTAEKINNIGLQARELIAADFAAKMLTLASINYDSILNDFNRPGVVEYIATIDQEGIFKKIVGETGENKGSTGKLAATLTQEFAKAVNRAISQGVISVWKRDHTEGPFNLKHLAKAFPVNEDKA